MRVLMDRYGGDDAKRGFARAGALLVALAMFVSGCASTSKLPWPQTRLPSHQLPKSELPSHKLPESYSFGVGDRPSSGLPWPEIKPKSLGPLARTSKFGL